MMRCVLLALMQVNNVNSNVLTSGADAINNRSGGSDGNDNGYTDR